MKMENELTAALLRRDFAALHRIYADDYVSVNSDGMLGEKASVLKELESGEITFIAITTDSVAVHVYGSTSVVTGQVEVRGRFSGRDLREQLKFMHVFTKRHGRWVLVAQQLTLIARPL